MALIIDMEAAIMRHYVEKRRQIRSSLTTDVAREKYKERLVHCNKVMKQFSIVKPATYVFTLQSTKQYGDPLKDFLINWNIVRNNLNSRLI